MYKLSFRGYVPSWTFRNVKLESVTVMHRSYNDAFPFASKQAFPLFFSILAVNLQKHPRGQV